MTAHKTIGIVGGGQLGRMLTLAALPLGFKVIVVDPTENCPAAQAGAMQIRTRLDDAGALQQLAVTSDFITFEIEHFDTTPLRKVGTAINPALGTVQMIQDKYRQKQFLHDAGIKVAPFVKVDVLADAGKALQDFSGKMLLKTRLGAYDGRGNAVIKNEKELHAAWERFGKQALYAEAFVPFQKELAVMAVRDVHGNVRSYPVTETIHERNICIETITPAQVDKNTYKKAENLALQVATHLKGAGVFGIEMFLTKDNDVLVNEIAPRVHNSGHYTMNGCATSQFEQHIRAVAGLPLGDTQLIVPAVAMINILGERNGDTKITGLDSALDMPGVYVHLYGKSPTKIDRKIGHINVIGKNTEEIQVRARKARGTIGI